MRVSIHDQVTMPFHENNGISIQPGTETSAGVRSVSLRKRQTLKRFKPSHSFVLMPLNRPIYRIACAHTQGMAAL